MLNDVKVARGLGVAVVSIFLVAGAAFAADGIVNPARQDEPAIVSPSSDTRSASPSGNVVVR